MNKPRKILIIKTGFSEFLDKGVSTTISLGDVLLCTVILHLYKNDHVTWVTSWAAKELLKGNPYIAKLLVFGPETFKSLEREPYDVLVNLEKDIGLCAFVNHVKARKRYGFYFDTGMHDITIYEKATAYLLSGQENHKNIKKSFFEIIYEAVGSRWQGEGVILNWKSKAAETNDIGFNYSVGSKWPTKAWPMANWKKLYARLSKKHSISWQKGHRNIFKYIEWIDSCRMIVTNDSLGQAIAHALGKKVVTLYGPTNYRRMQGVEHVTVIASTLKCPHMPCFLPVCQNDKFCMDYIEVDKVAAVCERLLAK